jgi:hypothetical protein
MIQMVDSPPQTIKINENLYFYHLLVATLSNPDLELPLDHFCLPQLRAESQREPKEINPNSYPKRCRE